MSKYRRIFENFERLGQRSPQGDMLMRCDLAVSMAADADMEIASLRAENAQLREALATMRASRNHYLSAWLGELLAACEADAVLLEDLRPSLTALSEAIEARRVLGSKEEA